VLSADDDGDIETDAVAGDVVAVRNANRQAGERERREADVAASMK
jgi:hypothetical protein